MDLTKGLKISDFKHVRIFIDSTYKWGRGWTKKEADDFKKEVYPRLEQAGFSIRKDKEWGSSDHLFKKTAKGPLDHTDIYLHPMEFSGYATEEDIQKICGVLDECGNVCCITRTDKMDVYDLNDDAYAELLAENAAEILEMIKTGIRNKTDYDFEFDFMRKYMVPRVGGSSILSSGNFEYKWLKNFRQTAESLGLIEKKKKGES